MAQIQAIDVASAMEIHEADQTAQFEQERTNSMRSNGREERAENGQTLRDSVSASARAEGRSSDVPITQLQAEAKAQSEQIKAQLSNLSVENLLVSAQTELTSSDITRMSELLIGQEEQQLAEQERDELNTLHEKMVTMAATRAAALRLLKNRMEQGRSIRPLS